MALFTVDWEAWHSAIYPDSDEYADRLNDATMFLLGILRKYEVRAIWYVLGKTVLDNQGLFKEIKDEGHVIGWHGMRHYHNLRSKHALFRSPYWDTTPMPWPPSGGFFFRALPYAYVKWAVKKSGQFWIHPHDLMELHPKLPNPLLNLKRQVGQSEARAKLDRLLSEVAWHEPSQN